MKWEKQKEKAWEHVNKSNICWPWAYGEVILFVKCIPRWPGPFDSQQSERFGWGHWGLRQSNEFHYCR